MTKYTPNRKNLIFLTFFPECEDIHLTKDVGMIPYTLHKYFSYDAYILTYKNSEYNRLESETPGLKLCYFDRSKNNTDKFNEKQQKTIECKHKIIRCALDSLKFFSKYGKEINILQLYHNKLESLIVASLFRFFNPKGVIYLKLDINPDSIQPYCLNQKKMKMKTIIQSLLLKFILFDIISAEAEFTVNYLKTEHPLYKKFQNNIYYIPNGVDFENHATVKILQQPPNRENIILHVGRLGTYPKGTEIALEAFVKIAHFFPQWKLVLVGMMTESFKNYFNTFIETHKDVDCQIIYRGYLSSREEIMREYAKSKIILQPSRYESFGFIVAEAGIFGTVLVGSDIVSFNELTNNGVNGYLCPVDDVECFSNTLNHILSHPEFLEEKSKLHKAHIQKEYDWKDICTGLNDLLISSIQK